MTGEKINGTRKVLIFISLFLPLCATQASGGHPHRSLDQAMAKVSRYANSKNFLAVDLSLMFLGREEEFATAQVMLLSVGASAGVAAGLKYLVDRRRPTPPSPRSNSSFPSGHATVAFAAATIVGRSYPRLSLPAFALAGTVAYSRLYLRRHYPSDVLAGALLGWATARLLWRYRRRLTLSGTGLIGAFSSPGHAALGLAIAF